NKFDDESLKQAVLASGQGQQVGIGFLHLGQRLGSQHRLLQALVIKLVGGGPGGASTEYGAHRDHVILFRHVLVDGVVGEAGERALPAGDESFHFIGGGEFFQAFEYFGGFVFSQHSALSNQHSAHGLKAEKSKVCANT